MKTFAQLLTDHLQRAGVSDAELARHLGVRRQTIFRWKEGLTQRPRERQDVLRIAGKLRLSDEERDELLLAAGFRPEEALQDAETPGETQVEPATIPAAGFTASDVVDPPDLQHYRRLALLPWLMAGAVVVVLALIVLLGRGVDLPDLGGVLSLGGRGEISPAEPGETLILISQFANYSGGQAGFNVAGRLREALEEKVAEAGLPDVRIAVLPEISEDAQAALSVGRYYGATLVIWGEYDSGRVVAFVRSPLAGDEDGGQMLRRTIDTPVELSVTINSDLPQEVRWMTLFLLGQVHFAAGRYEPAGTALRQALAEPVADEDTLSSIYFQLGYIEGARAQPDLSQQIAYYTFAIDYDPGFVSAFNNRGLAYLQRNAQGDLARSVADLRQAIALKPDFAPAHSNLAFALQALGDDFRAEALASLERAQALQPDAAGPNNALCWNYSLLGRAEEALAYCDRAVAADPTAYSRDSRGLAYALLGRYDEAAGEFQKFLDWLRSSAPDEYDHYGPQREAWIAVLRQGQNPFDDATLQRLRQE